MTKDQIVEAIDSVINVAWKNEAEQAHGSTNNVKLCVYKNSVSCVVGRDKSMFTIWSSMDLVEFKTELSHLMAKHKVPTS